MIHISTIFHHDDNDIGAFFYYEIDDNGYIVRQIEIYRDLSFGLASKSFEYGNTFISGEKIILSDINEVINHDDDDSITFYISELQFNKIWDFFLKIAKTQ